MVKSLRWCAWCAMLPFSAALQSRWHRTLDAQQDTETQRIAASVGGDAGGAFVCRYSLARRSSDVSWRRYRNPSGLAHRRRRQGWLAWATVA